MAALDAMLAQVRLPEGEDGRAEAIAGFVAQARELHAAGRHEDVVQLGGAWAQALEHEAPDDVVAWSEAGTCTGWALHLTSDEHAAERVLTLAMGYASQGADEAQAEDRRLRRAQRAMAASATGRGLLYLDVTGEPEAARRTFMEALPLWGGDAEVAVDKARTLAGLGRADAALGDLQTAQVYLVHAVRLVAEAGDPAAADDLALLLAWLGEIEERLGDEEQAEQRLRAAVACAEEARAGDSTALAETEAALGAALLRWGCPSEAEVHLRRASGMHTRLTSPLHSSAVGATLTLAHAVWGRGHVDDATVLAGGAAVGADIHLRHLLEMGPEEVRIRRAAATRTGLDLCLSLAWENPAHPTLPGVALDAALRRKGLLAEIFASQRVAQRAYDSAGHQLRLDELDRMRESLSEALIAGDSASVAELTREVTQREERIGLTQRLQFDLEPEEHPEAARDERVARLSEWAQSGARLGAALDPRSALVEYVRFTRLAARPWEQAQTRRSYLAIVWRGGEAAPSVVPLGEAAEIDRRVAALRRALAADGDAYVDGTLGSFAGSETEAAAEAVRAAVLDPLLPAVGDARRLLIAPDGDLATLPFAVLPMPEGHVADRFELTNLTSGRDLLRPSEPPPAGFQAPLVLADPDYGAPKPYERLPETREEGADVARMLGVAPVMGEEASEGRLRRVRSPTVVHVATHGWFLPDADGDTVPAWATLPRFAPLVAGGASSWLARSGLVLAGFNTVWTGGRVADDLGDGVLTAGEAASLDLAGTELVVLSACETGLGRVADLEGIFGLRRGFEMAGARAVVMALFPVPDGPTRSLMLAFYRRVLGGETRAAALREAQLELRAEAAHPVLWGGFALHGDPTALRVETLAALRGASPDVDSGDDAALDAQRRLAAEALRRGDADAAEARVSAAAEAGDAFSAMILAISAVERGDGAAGERWYERAAAAGQPLAALALGHLRLTAGDEAGAERWWTTAAEAGNDDALHSLAALLRRRGDREAALRWWRAGAERGHPACLYAVGNEADMDGDRATAREYWLRAADAGVASAAARLAGAAQDDGDAAETDRWYRRAAELGYADAAKQFGATAHAEGRVDEALALWRAAAEAGDVECAHNVGFILEQRGSIEAERWYRMAADQGFPQSANNLGNRCANRGDQAGAERYWRIAAENGHTGAPVSLGRLALEGGDLEEAERLLRPAAEAGNPVAADGLALLLERTGSPEAERWLRIAADAGHPDAAARLGDAAAERGDTEEALRRWQAAA
ncbi:MAG TPA: CHAT domain-containing protein, partial [Solirubrobacteraceae bacterium]